MAYPGIVYAILVGVAVGAAVYAFFAGEQPRYRAQSQRQISYNDYVERYDTLPTRGRPRSGTNSNDKSGSTKKRRNSNENCSICLDPMDEPLKTTKLRCNHEFHKECILLWIRQKSEQLCPICRSKTSF